MMERDYEILQDLIVHAQKLFSVQYMTKNNEEF